MRIRNTGESLSRPFPRLQRTRRCRGRTSHSDVKRRASKCPPFPFRAASGLPPLLPAATSISNAPTCRRCPPSYLHGYRDTPLNPPSPFAAPSFHVAALTIFLQCGLSTAASASQRTQAQSPRRVAAARASFESRAASQSLRSSYGKCLTTTCEPELLPPAVSSTAARSALLSASHAPPPPAQPASQ